MTNDMPCLWDYQCLGPDLTCPCEDLDDAIFHVLWEHGCGWCPGGGCGGGTWECDGCALAHVRDLERLWAEEHCLARRELPPPEVTWDLAGKVLRREIDPAP